MGCICPGKQKTQLEKKMNSDRNISSKLPDLFSITSLSDQEIDFLRTLTSDEYDDIPKILFWHRLEKNPGLPKFAVENEKMFLENVEKGVPYRFRKKVWKILLEEDPSTKELKYLNFLRAKNESTEKWIHADPSRTFPNGIGSFFLSHALSLNQLSRIILAWGNLDSGIGYVQGMTYLVTLLLFLTHRTCPKSIWRLDVTPLEILIVHAYDHYTITNPPSSPSSSSSEFSISPAEPNVRSLSPTLEANISHPGFSPTKGENATTQGSDPSVLKPLSFQSQNSESQKTLNPRILVGDDEKTLNPQGLDGSQGKTLSPKNGEKTIRKGFSMNDYYYLCDHCCVNSTEIYSIIEEQHHQIVSHWENYSENEKYPSYRSCITIPQEFKEKLFPSKSLSSTRANSAINESVSLLLYHYQQNINRSTKSTPANILDHKLSPSELMTFDAEEEAFLMFVRLLKSSQYNLCRLYEKGLQSVQLLMHCYQKLLDEIYPKISNHIKNSQIDTNMYAVQWFMSLFIYSLPVDCVIRVLDYLLAHKEEMLSMIDIALALVSVKERRILSSSDAQCLRQLKCPVRIVRPCRLHSRSRWPDANAANDCFGREQGETGRDTTRIGSEIGRAEVGSTRRGSASSANIRIDTCTAAISGANDATSSMGKGRDTAKYSNVGRERASAIWWNEEEKKSRWDWEGTVHWLQSFLPANSRFSKATNRSSMSSRVANDLEEEETESEEEEGETGDIFDGFLRDFDENDKIVKKCLGCELFRECKRIKCIKKNIRDCENFASNLVVKASNIRASNEKKKNIIKIWQQHNTSASSTPPAVISPTISPSPPPSLPPPSCSPIPPPFASPIMSPLPLPTVQSSSASMIPLSTPPTSVSPPLGSSSSPPPPPSSSLSPPSRLPL